MEYFVTTHNHRSSFRGFLLEEKQRQESLVDLILRVLMYFWAPPAVATQTYRSLTSPPHREWTIPHCFVPPDGMNSLFNYKVCHNMYMIGHDKEYHGGKCNRCLLLWQLYELTYMKIYGKKLFQKLLFFRATDYIMSILFSFFGC